MKFLRVCVFLPITLASVSVQAEDSNLCSWLEGQFMSYLAVSRLASEEANRAETKEDKTAMRSNELDNLATAADYASLYDVICR